MASVKESWHHIGADKINPVRHRFEVQFRENGDWYCKVQRDGGPVHELYQDALHIEQLQRILAGENPHQFMNIDDVGVI